MSTINGAPLKADTVKASLDDYILLGMNAAAYLLPLPRRYPQFIPEATKLKAIL
jgi:hypothetical protein